MEMEQKTLIYCFVAKGCSILADADCNEVTGNFTTIAAQCLPKIHSSINNQYSLNCDGFTLNYLVQNGFTYCVVATKSAGTQIPMAFLKRIKELFTKIYDGGKGANAVANSLKKEFGPKLKYQMRCVDHPEEFSKLSKVKDHVSEVKGVTMGQQSLNYCFVARGNVILADSTDFSTIALGFLQEFSASSNSDFTYSCDGHSYHYLVDEGFTYCVVSAESDSTQIPMAFLKRIKEEFTKIYGGGKAATAVANSLKKEFGPRLKDQMQYCVDHPEEFSKLSKDQVSEVLDRGEKIELLVDKTENLHSQISNEEEEVKKTVAQNTQFRENVWTGIKCVVLIGAAFIVVKKFSDVCDSAKDVMASWKRGPPVQIVLAKLGLWAK